MTSSAIAGSLPTWATQFPYGPVEAPQFGVTPIAPAFGSISGGTSVVISGSKFMGNGSQTATVIFDSSDGTGGVPATNIVLLDDATITCATPAHAAGLVALWISTLAGGIGLLDAYEYRLNIALHAPPLAPATGAAAGGTAITLTGSTFTLYGATTCSILFGSSDGTGGVAATSVVVVNDTTITLVSPAHAVGVVDVWMQLNDTRTAVMPGAFTYT